jgi:hypothetical protein
MKHVLRILDSPHKQHRSTSVTTRHAASLAFTVSHATIHTLHQLHDHLPTTLTPNPGQKKEKEKNSSALITTHAHEPRLSKYFKDKNSGHNE